MRYHPKIICRIKPRLICGTTLYEDELQKLAAEYARQVDQLPLPYNYYDLTKIFFEFYTASSYAERLYCDPKYHDFSGRLQLVTLQHNRKTLNPYAAYSPEMQNIINAFVTNASSYAFRQWVADGKKVPMEEAIAITGKLLQSGVSSITGEQLPPTDPTEIKLDEADRQAKATTHRLSHEEVFGNVKARIHASENV